MKCPKAVLMISLVYLILEASPLLVSMKVGKYSSNSASTETPMERWRAVDSISFQNGKSSRRDEGFQEEKRFSPTGSNPLHNL